MDEHPFASVKDIASACGCSAGRVYEVKRVRAAKKSGTAGNSNAKRSRYDEDYVRRSRQYAKSYQAQYSKPDSEYVRASKKARDETIRERQRFATPINETKTERIIRLLSAKAESTEFAGEREALLAKVRDLQQKSA